MPVSANSATDLRAGMIAAATQKFIYDEFRTPILCMDGPGDLTVPETTGPNVFITGNGNVFEYEGIGTLDAATILWNADTGLDLTDIMTSNNVGVSITPALAAGKASTTGLRTKNSFTVGTDKPFYCSLKFTLADVSGTDGCVMGFIKTQAKQTAVDTIASYTDFSFLNAQSGTIYTHTRLNTGTAVKTSTTQSWADTETHTFTVVCDSDGSLGGTVGKVYFAIDGVKPTTTQSFTHDTGDVLIPIFIIQNDSDIANGTVLLQWESGLFGVGQGIAIAAT